MVFRNVELVLQVKIAEITDADVLSAITTYQWEMAQKTHFIMIHP